MKQAKYITDDIEGAKLSRSHIKVMLIAGMSFFTDAYDLFVIGVVLLMLRSTFTLGTFQLGILASAALFGAVIGPVLFGRVADRFGRKSTFWITVTILIIGALGSATSLGWLQLVIWRFVLGIGIGGDYPISSTIVAEYANRNDRGKLVASTFSMQGFGIAAGVAAAFLLLHFGIPSGYSWRLLLAFGAIPSVAILYYRLKFKETPTYNLMNGNVTEAMKTMGLGTKTISGGRLRLPKIKLRDFMRQHWKIVIGTALAWFLMDISYYGTGIFTPYLASLFGFSGVYAATKVSALVLVLFAVPGYWIAVALIDREGRKPMQAIGFLVMGVAFLILSIYGSALLAFSSAAFFALYGITFLFTNYGPNTTTYVYPVETYPTSIRATGHGIAATSGKLGAAISAMLFPIVIGAIGKFSLLAVLGGIAFVGFLITIFLLPETKRRSLVETSGEAELMMVTATLNNEFSSHIGSINDATKLLHRMLTSNGKDSGNVMYRRIKDKERAADRNVHNIYDYISSMRTGLVSYIDVSHLASKLDDIIDMEEAAAARLAMYGVTRPDKPMREFAELIDKCVFKTLESVGLMSDLMAGNTSVQKLLKENYIAASDYEGKADELLRRSLGALMRLQNAKEVIVKKDIYEMLEDITDRCIDVFDVLNDITMRYLKGNGG
ncbi:MFS transporter [Candidatus Marsarchaeota archaeon]|nr:MFS transporter [Candidatus Marsarchaeota archaeon]